MMNKHELELQHATINELLNDPESSIKDLASVINDDPPLARRIISTANSPLYGSERKKVLDLTSAIVRMGFRNVKHIVFEHIKAKEKSIKEEEAQA